MNKHIKKWWSFEGRCIVCGKKYLPGSFDWALTEHLKKHVRDGFMKLTPEGFAQIKIHPHSPFELSWKPTVLTAA